MVSCWDLDLCRGDRILREGRGRIWRGCDGRLVVGDGIGWERDRGEGVVYRRSL